jgi:hypothetical protein
VGRRHLRIEAAQRLSALSEYSPEPIPYLIAEP